jgi:hypothetical protein
LQINEITTRDKSNLKMCHCYFYCTAAFVSSLTTRNNIKKKRRRNNTKTGFESHQTKIIHGRVGKGLNGFFVVYGLEKADVLSGP